MMHLFVFRFLLLSTLLSNTVALSYSVGSTDVTVTSSIVDVNNSTKKCVTYKTNSPEKYTTACFTTTYTDGATFYKCALEFNSGKDKCDKCGPCTDLNENVGFNIDCDAFMPAKSNSINGREECTVLNDMSIQAVLTDGVTFDAMPFDFSISPSQAVTDDSNMKSNTTTTKTNSAASSNTFFATGFTIAAAFIVLAL
jgi:hypothetical protein